MRRELGRGPSRARRFGAPLYVLFGLAGIALVAFAPTPRFEPVGLIFSAVAAGLLLSGTADLVPARASGARAALRLAGFVSGMVGLLALVLASVLAAG